MLHCWEKAKSYNRMLSTQWLKQNKTSGSSGLKGKGWKSTQGLVELCLIGRTTDSSWFFKIDFLQFSITSVYYRGGELRGEKEKVPVPPSRGSHAHRLTSIYWVSTKRPVQPQLLQRQPRATPHPESSSTRNIPRWWSPLGWENTKTSLKHLPAEQGGPFPLAWSIFCSLLWGSAAWAPCESLLGRPGFKGTLQSRERAALCLQSLH